jgi:hypothetical protein
MLRSVTGPPHRALLWPAAERRPTPRRADTAASIPYAPASPHFLRPPVPAAKDQPAFLTAAGPGRERPDRISHGRWSWPSKTRPYFTWPLVPAVRDQPAFHTAAGPGRQGNVSYAWPRERPMAAKPSGNRIVTPRRARSHAATGSPRPGGPARGTADRTTVPVVMAGSSPVISG